MTRMEEFPSASAAVLRDTSELAWLAGIIDGEGYVGLKNRKIGTKNGYGENGLQKYVKYEQRAYPSIVVGMSCITTIQRLRHITGLGSLKVKKKYEHQTNKKTIWFWSIYGEKARLLAMLILPYAVTKRDALLDVIARTDVQ
jgi:hypothetical protein